MPVVPSAALRLARFELEPLPSTADEVYADHETVDAPAVRPRTRQAVGYVTALIQGLTWPRLSPACIVLAFSQDVTAQVLAGIVGVGLLLRARLFITIGQRLPLLIAGIGSIAALLVGADDRVRRLDGAVAVAVPALVGVIVCAAARRPAPPGVAGADPGGGDHRAGDRHRRRAAGRRSARSVRLHPGTRRIAAVATNTKDNLQAHRFMNRRVRAALLEGDAESNTRPLARLGTGTYAGIFVTIALLAVVGIIGVLQTRRLDRLAANPGRSSSRRRPAPATSISTGCCTRC